MKKVLLIAAGLSLSFMGIAQKKNVTTAIQALANDEFTEAKKAIDAAVLDESTKDDPKAWSTRGDVYSRMMAKNLMPESEALPEITKSYLKAAQLKPDYQRDEMDKRLMNIAYTYYNVGINSYNAKKYADASAALKNTVDIHDLEGGKRFAANKSFDTIATEAQRIRAYSAYYSNSYDEAATLLTGLNANPISKDPNNYLMLADIYKKQNKDAQFQSIIEEGRKQYPENSALRNEELNLYIKSGKQDELVKKLEVAVASEKDEKTKADLMFNLANAYNNMAFPKDASGKDIKKPANYQELIGKAETNYLGALKISPNKAEYQYNTGALYFNEATEYNNQMNAVTGNSAADMKKYEDLKKQRDAMFAKATPYLEQTFNILDAKHPNLSEEDKFTYQSSIIALRNIYLKLNQTDKAAKMKQKLDAIK